MKQLPTSIFLKKEDGKLVPKSVQDKIMLKHYVDNMEEGSIVKVTYEDYSLGSYAQISKLQASIREISNYLGYSIDEVKDIVKHKANLYTEDGNLKSFADCSKEELSQA
ncbi:MAG: hypothetical protein EBU90_28970, partial [Proteobacteria bacterium]|nr:hypothetical protein [Pseudomonadota bacterium]